MTPFILTVSLTAAVMASLTVFTPSRGLKYLIVMESVAVFPFRLAVTVMVAVWLSTLLTWKVVFPSSVLK